MTDTSNDLGTRGTLVDDIVAAIRDRIVRGELEPGLKIRQQEFADELGVSRTPLREAFQRLEADGWVQLRARRGAEVRTLDVAEAEEIFTMRVVLETAAARLSAVTHDPADETVARGLIRPKAGGRSTALGSLDDANQRFHDLVYGLGTAAIPRELSSTLERYWTRALRYRLVYWARPAAVAHSEQAHRVIFDAWSARDPDATERAVANHILTALWQITERIDATRAPSAALLALADRYGVDGPSTRSSEV